MRAALFLVSILAVAVVGCGRDRAPVPASEIGVEQTPSLPTATQTPASRPTQTATPKPTLTSSVEYHFDALSPDDQALIRAGIEIAEAYLRERAALAAPRVDVFAGSDARRLALRFLDFTKSPVFQGSNFMLRIANGVAEANLASLFVYTEAPIWRSSNAVQRVRIVAHEFTHVVQFELMGETLARRFFTREAGAPQPEGASWLFEGTADLVSWRAMEQAGFTSLEEHLRAEGTGLAGSDLHPRLMETFIDYVAGGTDSIEVALLAADLLLRGKDEEPLRHYFEGLRAGAAWQTAFAQAFGETPEAFYVRFDEYKRSGFKRP